MHIAFLAPEYPPDQGLFVQALKRMGARVSGIGHVSLQHLHRPLRGLLDEYERVGSVEDPVAVTEAAQSIDRRRPLDRVETVQEQQVIAAAHARAHLGLPGTALRTARLCRDKAAMKEELRRAGIPCAASGAASSQAEAREIAVRIGWPLVLKPRGGFGGLQTFRVESGAELEQALAQSPIGHHHPVVLEELIDGHEGFVDTLTVGGQVAHEFVAHYYPNVLEALSDPRATPQVVATNRIEAPGYQELLAMNRRVIEVLGLHTSATHMEWLLGPQGLRFSEIGARPPGERLWELHAIGNDLDLHLEWASAVVLGRHRGTASRRFAAGSVQLRPDRQGRIDRYQGLEAIGAECGRWIFSAQVLTRGYPTTPLHLGYLGNVWFRLFHPDYDELRRMLDFIGRRLRILAS